jgi:hypothetical protein
MVLLSSTALGASSEGVIVTWTVALSVPPFPSLML